MEEGIGLFGQLLPWLIENYPGRVVSWRLECASSNGEMILEATARLQLYADLMFGEGGLDGGVIDQLQVKNGLACLRVKLCSKMGLSLHLGIYRGGDGALISYVDVVESNVSSRGLAVALTGVMAKGAVGLKQIVGKYRWED